MPSSPRKVCFVTGTRAEYGLMRSTLDAIRAHPNLELQLIATGMHLDRSRGRTVNQIRRDGYAVHATVPWPAGDSPAAVAGATGTAMAKLAAAFEQLQTDIVLVVGDRVEAFAAAAAGAVSQRVVAHVHGGDRALGQVDDALRHAITKLAHLHFPATRASAARIVRMGEDKWRVHAVGTPGVDGIRAAAAAWPDVSEAFDLPGRRRYALLVLHPTDAADAAEARRAAAILAAATRSGVPRVVVVYPNNDPGAAGIARCWAAAEADRRGPVTFHRDVPRPLFLGLLRDAAFLLGNSSAGIIEAGSFRTPVIDVGDRQAGRERGVNVTHIPDDPAVLNRAAARAWNGGNPRRATAGNVYGGGHAGRRIADVLGRVPLGGRLNRKLIAY